MISIVCDPNRPSFCVMVDMLIYVLWSDLKLIDECMLDETTTAISAKKIL